ncbi:hypothetical protein Q3F77_11055 [Enterococcus faecium]|nr:hypothetical protein [Enterococcus faecium]
MFQFFKKKKEVIYAPCSGQVIPITEVKDPSVIIVFTEENQINNLNVNNGLIENNQFCGEIYS